MVGATAAGVEFVRFRRRSKNRVHTFAVAPDSTDTAVGVFTGSYDRKAMPRSDVEILHARFRFRYAGPSGRGKLFRVSVTGNDRSNLKSLSTAERGIAETHLVAWGVMDE